jgi:RNA polymerase sigma-70 factor (ECF subfamily)
MEPRLRAYLYYAGAGREDMEDLVQDTCLKAHLHWGELAGHPEPAAWVLLVARNGLRNHRKRADLERRAMVARRAEPHRGVPEDPAEGAELSAAIQVALAKLPEAHREAVVGKIWGGLNWSQIGTHLGVSEDTAARLFARGLRALRPMLGRFAS